MTLAQRICMGVALWICLTGTALAQGEGSSASLDSDASQQILVLLRMPAEHLQANGGYGASYGGAARVARRRIATRLAASRGLKLELGWPMPVLGVDCYVMTVGPDQSPKQVAAELSLDRRVVWSEPMSIYGTQASNPPPNDPMFLLQPAAGSWRLADLHELATGRGVKVAVIDSAIDARHPDLLGQILIRQNFVLSRPDAPEHHGTSVAGVIAARADNGVGIAGIAPGARLLALRACWQSGSEDTVCDALSLARALNYAIENRAQIINLSLSGPPNILLGRLLDVALERGMTVVGAVDPDLEGGGFPARHPGVVAVASWPSSRALGVSAPGRDVPTTQPGGGWGLSSGSSYATAHVSGLFALALERTPRAKGLATLVTEGAGGAINTCATLQKSHPPCDACGCANRTPALARP